MIPIIQAKLSMFVTSSKAWGAHILAQLQRGALDANIVCVFMHTCYCMVHGTHCQEFKKLSPLFVMKSTYVCISNLFQFHNAILTLEVICSNGEMSHYDMTKNIHTIK